MSKNGKNIKTLLKEWKEVLEHPVMPEIKDKRVKATTAIVLENLNNYFISEKSTVGDIAKYDKVLIKLIRRAMPDLIANDIVGVQPMKSPTGLVFAIRAHYAGSTDDSYKPATTRLVWLKRTNDTDPALNTYVAEGAQLSITDGTDTWTFTIKALGTITADYGVILVSEDATGTLSNLVSGTGTIAGNSLTITRVESNEALFNAILTKYAGPYATTTMENMSTNIRELGFTIEKSTVSADGRLLKAKYSLELYEDFKNLHGGDADIELMNILSGEMVAEINRNIIDTVNSYAMQGGTYSYDANSSDGRWSLEKFTNLYTVINKAANDIALANRRGRGNFIIASPDVITALEAAGRLKWVEKPYSGNMEAPYALAGYLTNGMKVYRDMFAFRNYVTVGYKGSSPYDAGIFYCPYIPMQPLRATGEEDFQPRIGFRERSAIGLNPFGPENYYRMIYVDFGSLLTT